jgi:hypothetical protein
MQRAFLFDNPKKKIYEQRRDQSLVNITGVHSSDVNHLEGQTSRQ